MLKLVRSAYADLKVLIDDNGNEIRWANAKNLLDIQENSGIRAANKLTVNHVNFHKHKMKVKLAAHCHTWFGVSRKTRRIAHLSSGLASAVSIAHLYSI